MDYQLLDFAFPQLPVKLTNTSEVLVENSESVTLTRNEGVNLLTSKRVTTGFLRGAIRKAPGSGGNIENVEFFVQYGYPNEDPLLFTESFFLESDGEGNGKIPHHANTRIMSNVIKRLRVVNRGDDEITLNAFYITKETIDNQIPFIPEFPKELETVKRKELAHLVADGNLSASQNLETEVLDVSNFDVLNIAIICFSSRQNDYNVIQKFYSEGTYLGTGFDVNLAENESEFLVLKNIDLMTPQSKIVIEPNVDGVDTDSSDKFHVFVIGAGYNG